MATGLDSINQKNLLLFLRNKATESERAHQCDQIKIAKCL